MKKVISLILVLVLIALIVFAVAFALGGIKIQRLDVSKNDVASIHVVNGDFGTSIEILDPNEIDEIVDLINDTGLGIGTPNSRNGWKYTVYLKNESGDPILKITVVDAAELRVDGYSFGADVSALMTYLEGLGLAKQ